MLQFRHMRLLLLETIILSVLFLVFPLFAHASTPTELLSFQEGSQVTLTWKAPADIQVIGYTIYRGSALNALTQIARVGATTPNEVTSSSPPTTLYTDGSVTPGSSYYYKVKAIDSLGYESAASGATATTVYQLSSVKHSDGAASVAVTGDFNGDGRTDIALGYPYAQYKGKSRGKVSIFFGTTGTKPVVTELYGEFEGDNFGKSLVAADLNKDGFADLVVGAPQYTDPLNTGLWDEGKVYIYAGGAVFNKTPAKTIVGGEVSSPSGVYYVGEGMGEQLSAVGDINGDGYPDVAIGTPLGGYDRSGSVYILYGATPLDTYAAKIYGLVRDDAFGSALAPAGDITGDGFNDIWSSYATGYSSPLDRKDKPGIYLIKGSRFSEIDRTRVIPGGPAFTATDFNGDGNSDVAAYTNNTGNIAVYSGRPADGIMQITTTPIGFANLFPANDINGDGKHEIITNGALIFFGHNGLPRTPYLSTGIYNPIIGVVDVNGDGIQEAILADSTSNITSTVALNPFQGLPTVVIAPDIENSSVTASSTHITGSVSGSPSLLLVGGIQTPVAADGSFSAVVPLKDGKNYVEVIARATDGRITKRYLIVNAVTTPLTVTVTSPASGSVLTTNPVTVQGTVSEQNAQVTVNGAAATVAGTSWTATLSLANGQQIISVQATDSFQRTATASVVITFSAEIPTGTIVGSVADTNGIPLSVAAITVVDAANTSHSTASDIQGRYSLLKVPAGTYYAQFSKIGFIEETIAGSLAANQTLDLSVQLLRAPALQIALNSPLAGTVFHTAQAVVSGTVTNNATVTVNGTPAEVVAGSFSAATTLTQGTSQITATAHDTYGQNATVSMPVTYLPGPLLMDMAAVPLTTNAVKITWRTDQPATGTVDYGATTDYGFQATQAVSGYDHTVTLNGLTPGSTYHLKISATNSNGFTTTGPDISVTLPAFSVNFMADQGNVGVYAIEGNYDAKSTDGSINSAARQAVAKEYFKKNPDKDFLVFFSTFDYAMPEPGAKGFYLEVKNDTQGINRAILDTSAQYGSTGMLQGTIDMGNITLLAADLTGPKRDETVLTLIHELEHRWLAAVRFKQADGSLSNDLIGKDNSHWSYLLDSKGSLMYGNGWKDNGDGSFTAVSTTNGFSPLDLYLMGMLPKEQVPPMLLIDNPAIDKTKLPELGATITGTAKTVSIDDIIAAEGARVPNASASQKKFNIGFVLLTRAGDDTIAAVQTVETVRNAFAGKFAELTRGVGGIEGVAPSLTVTIESPASGATITGPYVTVSGSFINTSGAETGITINGMPAIVSGSRFIANNVSLQPGDNTITITATDANGLTTTTTRTVAAQAGNYLRVTSNIESGTAPLDVSLRVDGSFTPTNPQLSIQGPAAATLQTGTQPNEYTAKLTVEGSYTIIATATGPDGQTYTASTTITVLNRYQLETLLQGKWEGMKAKIEAGDVEGAVSYFITSLQQDYREAFTEAGTSLPLLSNYLNPLELVYANDNTVKCRMTRTEQINEQTQQIEYVLYFNKENGIWKLRDF